MIVALPTDTKRSALQKTWRACEGKLVYNDIIAQPLAPQKAYMEGMSDKYSGTGGAPLSTLSRDIKRTCKLAKEKSVNERLGTEMEI